MTRSIYYPVSASTGVCEIAIGAEASSRVDAPNTTEPTSAQMQADMHNCPESSEINNSSSCSQRTDHDVITVWVHDLPKVGMRRWNVRLAEKRLVPFHATGHILDADNRPCVLHRLLSRVVAIKSEHILCIRTNSSIVLYR